MPCRFLNLSNLQPVEALKLSWLDDSPFTCSCKEKCFAFSWRSGPEIGVPVDLCWMNQVYKAWSNRSLFASFSDFRLNPSLVPMLSVNFRILSLSLRLSEICYLLMPNSSAKFVPFFPLSKREIIICLSFVERTDRFRFGDMLSFELWPLLAFTKTHAHRTDQGWHSLSIKTILNQSKFSWMHQNALHRQALNLLKAKR